MNPHDVLLSAVERAVERGYWERAERLSRMYVRIRPKNPRAWDLLASVLGRRGDFGGAVTTLKEALGRMPESTFLKCELAGYLVDVRELAEAEVLLDEAREEAPASPDVNVARAALALRKGEWATARSIALDVISNLDPRKPGHAAYLAEMAALLLYFRDERERGKSLLSQAASYSPGYLTPHLVLAPTAAQEGSDDQEAYLREARRRWRGSPERFEEEFESCKRALEIAPLNELK